MRGGSPGCRCAPSGLREALNDPGPPSRPREFLHSRSRAPGQLLFRRARPARGRALPERRISGVPQRARGDRARARRRGGAETAELPGRARQRSRGARARAVRSRHQDRAAQRRLARHRRRTGVHRHQGHVDRAVRRLCVRGGRRRAGGDHAAQARPCRLPGDRRAGGHQVLHRRARLPRLRLARHHLLPPTRGSRFERCSERRVSPARPSSRSRSGSGRTSRSSPPSMPSCSSRCPFRRPTGSS